MRFNFFYGTKPKISQSHAGDFSRKGYECNLVLQDKTGQPVAVSRNTELDVWKVEHNFTCVFFATYAEAMAYCKGRFFDADGKAV